MTEIWEDIKDYEGLYQISNLGKIKSLDRVVATSNQYKATGSRMVKDENKQNNHVDNLEWCTHQYNTNYNNMPFKRAENRREKVLQYDKNGNLIKKWNSMTEASKHSNISRSNISLCCSRKRKTAGGFIWKYFDELSKMRSLEESRKK